MKRPRAAYGRGYSLNCARSSTCVSVLLSQPRATDFLKRPVRLSRARSRRPGSCATCRPGARRDANDRRRASIRCCFAQVRSSARSAIEQCWRVHSH
jgi:hypothetical protein